MNQILATSAPNKNKKGKKGSNHQQTDIRSVIKIFSIVLLLFGIFLVGSGSYAMVKEGSSKGTAQTKPTITLENKAKDTILLKITSDKPIDQVSYRWNDEQEVTISGNGRKYVEQQITIPTGSNVLKVAAKDTEGGENSYQQPYELESKIGLEPLASGKIKITYEGETQIAYMTYRWDDEEETKVEINDTKIDQEIEAMKGDHTLTVIVVDVNNRTETKVQETKGVSKPTIDISFNDDHTAYVIKVTDENELKEVRVVLDEDDNQKFKQELSGKEFTFQIPLKSGDNKMEVTVYNSADVSATQKVKFTKP
jgi:hypothetical protein